MRKVVVGAAAFGLALVSGAAVAQMQGPASSSYSTGGPNGPPTSGTSNNQTAQPNPNAGQGTLYNSAPGQGNNQARPQQRRGTTSHTH
jgi:hypothetical protein